MRIESFGRIALVSNLLDLQLVEAGLLQADPTWEFTAVCSPFNRLYFVQRGQGRVVCGQQELKLEPGRVYLIPAETTCDYHCPVSLEKIYLHFNLLLPDGTDLFASHASLCSFPCPDSQSATLLSLLRDCSLSGAFLLKQALWTHLLPFLSQIKGAVPLQERQNYSPLICAALETVRRQLSAVLKVSDVAAALSVSPEGLSRQFKKELGIGLKEYMDHVLFLRAKQLLASTNRTVKEIAFELQFSDPFYFSNFFKRKAGVAPTDYRRTSVLA